MMAVFEEQPLTSPIYAKQDENTQKKTLCKSRLVLAIKLGVGERGGFSLFKSLIPCLSVQLSQRQAARVHWNAKTLENFTSHTEHYTVTLHTEECTVYSG